MSPMPPPWPASRPTRAPSPPGTLVPARRSPTTTRPTTSATFRRSTSSSSSTGSTVTFTYVVTNTGNVPLANVAVTDDKLGPITSFTGDSNGNGLLDLTETWIYVANAAALAGQQTNTGTVTARDAGASTTVADNNPANYFGDVPAINIIKFVNGQHRDVHVRGDQHRQCAFG